jgi:hypothetical protein
MSYLQDTRLRRLGASIIEMILWHAPSRLPDPFNSDLVPNSLDFLPLGELLELLHTRKASDQRARFFPCSV